MLLPWPARLGSTCLLTWLAASLASVLLAGCAPSASGSPGASAGTVSVRDRPEVRALRLLQGWDRRRAAAYESGEPGRLRSLYAPGSRAGARDLRLLHGYAERGLVVEGLTVQLLEVRLLRASPSVVRLRVVDRVAGGAVRTHGSHTPEVALPVGAPEERVVTLVDLGRRWVVRSVRRPR